MHKYTIMEAADTDLGWFIFRDDNEDSYLGNNPTKEVAEAKVNHIIFYEKFRELVSYRLFQGKHEYMCAYGNFTVSSSCKDSAKQLALHQFQRYYERGHYG